MQVRQPAGDHQVELAGGDARIEVGVGAALKCHFLAGRLERGGDHSRRDLVEAVV